MYNLHRLPLTTNIGSTHRHLQLVELWNVVEDRRDRRDEQEELLRGEVLERVHDGEVPLHGDAHGHEHGAHAADVAEAVRHGQDARVHGAAVPRRDHGQPEDGDGYRQVEQVERGQA